MFRRFIFTLLIAVGLQVSVKVVGLPIQLDKPIADLARQSNYSGALLLCTNVQQQLSQKVYLLIRQGNSKEAVQFLEKEGPGVTNLTQINQSLSLLLDQSLNQEVIDIVDSISHENPSLGLPLNIPKSVALYRNGSGSVAVGLVRESIKKGLNKDTVVDSLFNQIIELYQSKQGDAALQHYQFLFTCVPEAELLPGHMVQWAQIANSVGRHQEAVSRLSKVEKLYPKYVKENAAMVAVAEGLSFEGIKAYDQANAQFSNIIFLAKQGDFLGNTYSNIAASHMAEIKKFQSVQAPSTVPPASEKGRRWIWILLVIFLAPPLILLGLKFTRGKQSNFSLLLSFIILAFVQSSKAAEQKAVVDFGTLSAPTNYTSHFKVNLDGSHTVKDIIASCGCTKPALKVGDIISKGTSVDVSVDTHGKAFGDLLAASCRSAVLVLLVGF